MRACIDGFIARFAADGSAVDYFTYIGGEREDQVRGIGLDGRGNVWVAGGTGSQDFPTTTNAPNPGYLGGPTDGFLARLPLPSRINPGPPVMEPLVTYVGDELQNFGLAIAVSPGARAAALSQQSWNQAFGEVIFYSLSNFTPEQGPFGEVTQFDVNGAPGGTVTTTGAEGFALVADPSGNSVIIGGIGLPNGTTTQDVVPSSFGGGTGTLPADGWVARATSTIDEGGVEITKSLDSIRRGSAFQFQERAEDEPPRVGDVVSFTIVIENLGGGDLRNVEIVDAEASTFDIQSLDASTNVSREEPECRLFRTLGVCTARSMISGEVIVVNVSAVLVREGKSENKVNVSWDGAEPVEVSVPIPEVLEKNHAVLDVEMTAEPDVGPDGGYRPGT